MTTIKIDTEIGYWGISSRDIKRQLNEADGDIVIEINSPGGSVIEGISIFNAIKDYNKGNVTVIIVGLAASMASYIALAGDTVKAYDNAIYMIHNAWQFVMGDHNELRKRALVLESMSKISRNAYVAKTGKSEDELQKAMDEETYYFGNEILDYGFVDEIISTENEKDKDSSMAFAQESFKGCLKNMEQNHKEEITEDVAALIKDFENKSLVENPSASAGKIDTTTHEEMDMPKNPNAESGAVAQNAEAIQSAQTDARASEKQRIIDIIALGGDMEFAQKAISEDMSVGDAAIALLKVQKDTTVSAKKEFENGAEELANIASEMQESEQMSAEDKAWQKAIEDKYKKGAK